MAAIDDDDDAGIATFQEDELTIRQLLSLAARLGVNRKEMLNAVKQYLEENTDFTDVRIKLGTRRAGVRLPNIYFTNPETGEKFFNGVNTNDFRPEVEINVGDIFELFDGGVVPRLPRR